MIICRDDLVKLPDRRLEVVVLLVHVLVALDVGLATQDDHASGLEEEVVEEVHEVLVGSSTVSVDDRRQCPTIEDHVVVLQKEEREHEDLEEELVEKLHELEEVGKRLCESIPEHPVDERVRHPVIEGHLDESHLIAFLAELVDEKIRLCLLPALVGPLNHKTFR